MPTGINDSYIVTQSLGPFYNRNLKKTIEIDKNSSLTDVFNAI